MTASEALPSFVAGRLIRKFRLSSRLGNSCERVVVPSLLVLLVAGCGGGENGPARFGVEGTITWNGNPVERAEISFVPDTTANNSGPAAYAFAKDGEFRIPAKVGPVAGPSNVRIVVYQGEGSTEPVGNKTLAVVVDADERNTFTWAISEGDLQTSRRDRSRDEGDGDDDELEEDEDG